jgi:hypothetical protein
MKPTLLKVVLFPWFAVRPAIGPCSKCDDEGPRHAIPSVLSLAMVVGTAWLDDRVAFISPHIDRWACQES